MSDSWINLISDTVTKPSKPMLEAMVNAEVGDDVFCEDPTVLQLQQKAAKLFNKESALFCSSGTMSNQIAIKLHTQPLDEVICEQSSHIFHNETGAYAVISQVAIRTVQSPTGKLTVDLIKSAIRPKCDWHPRSSLVVLDNPNNNGFYTVAEIAEISKFCRENDLKLHLDGARLFNVLVETNEKPEEVGQLVDTISLCLSKGLGAPVGTVLIGTEENTKRARRIRKAMGGGMRQVGILAAAGIYALDNNVERLRDDNSRAKRIAEHLKSLPYVESVAPVFVNMIFFNLTKEVSSADFLNFLTSHKIKAANAGPNTIRFVTHLDFTEEMCEKLLATLSMLQV